MTLTLACRIPSSPYPALLDTTISPALWHSPNTPRYSLLLGKDVYIRYVTCFCKDRAKCRISALFEGVCVCAGMEPWNWVCGWSSLSSFFPQNIWGWKTAFYRCLYTCHCLVIFSHLLITLKVCTTNIKQTPYSSIIQPLPIQNENLSPCSLPPSPHFQYGCDTFNTFSAGS